MGVCSRRIVISGAVRRKAGTIPRTAALAAVVRMGRKMTHAIVNLLRRRHRATQRPDRRF
jgi:hypothetical protein